MKTASLALSLSFFLFALLTKPLSSHPTPLFDVKGDKVEAGTAYYVMPATHDGGGGGLSQTFNRNGSCPLDVVQESSDKRSGYPMFFYPAGYNSKDRGYVYESMDVNIIFYANIINCDQPLVWKVDNYDAIRGAWYITTNGVLENPGPQTVQNWFKFERDAAGNAYKIAHCPSVSNFTVNLCADLGTRDDDYLRRVALRPEAPLSIHFIKPEAIPA